MRRVALAWLLLAASGAIAQPTTPEVGTWKMNKEKSRALPQSITLTVEQEGRGFRTTAMGISSTGHPFKIQFTAIYDGQDWPVNGYAGRNRASFRRIDERTIERIDKLNDRVVQTVRSVVSQDGRTMEVTHSPSGDFFFYERQ